MLLLAIGIGYAGTPVENYYQGQAPLSNTSIYGSSNTVNTATIPLSVPSCASGGQARNCFTKIQIALTAGASYYALDGGTTVQFVTGGALGTSGGLLTEVDDHLGPLCFASGTTTTLKITGGSAPSNFINYEGYTNCGGTDNQGPMK